MGKAFDDLLMQQRTLDALLTDGHREHAARGKQMTISYVVMGLSGGIGLAAGTTFFGGIAFVAFLAALAWRIDAGVKDSRLHDFQMLTLAEIKRVERDIALRLPLNE